MDVNRYGTRIPTDSEFAETRESQISEMGDDVALRQQAINLQLSAEAYGYGYQQTWCGVPIIRLPDDIVAFQEMVWDVRPAFIIETGIARGGSLILSASMMLLAGCEPRVLGIDVQVLEHTWKALNSSPFSDAITVWVGDSASPAAAAKVTQFVQQGTAPGPGILVLDSDHSYAHVLGEMRTLTQSLPEKSLLLVADTLISEVPKSHYPDRPWGHGNNPLVAVRDFLAETNDWVPSTKWGRRSLVTEFRDGVLEKVR